MSIVDGGWAEPRPFDEVMEEMKKRWMQDSGYVAPEPIYVSKEALPAWKKLLGQDDA